MWLSKAIHVDGTNQFDTNTCHHNKKLDQILSEKLNKIYVTNLKWQHQQTIDPFSKST